jgi:hypothetical protein
MALRLGLLEVRLDEPADVVSFSPVVYGPAFDIVAVAQMVILPHNSVRVRFEMHVVGLSHVADEMCDVAESQISIALAFGRVAVVLDRARPVPFPDGDEVIRAVIGILVVEHPFEGVLACIAALRESLACVRLEEVSGTAAFVAVLPEVENILIQFVLFRCAQSDHLQDLRITGEFYVIVSCIEALDQSHAQFVQFGMSVVGFVSQAGVTDEE